MEKHDKLIVIFAFLVFISIMISKSIIPLILFIIVVGVITLTGPNKKDDEDKTAN